MRRRTMPARGPAIRRPRENVKTRTLVLLALGCGLLILLAGGAQLVRIALQRDDVVEVLSVGQAASIGGVDATVLGAEAAGEVTDVRVLLQARSSRVLDAGAGWALLAGGRLRAQVPPTPADVPACAGQTLEPGQATTCVLGFSTAKAEGVVSLSRDDEQRQWGIG
jgi:hypothetical protein